MATINFPANPQLNDTYTFLGRTWIYNGIGWVVKPYNITAFVNKGGDTMSGKLTITSGGLSVSGTTSLEAIETSSQTLVDNLNADFLDGQEGAFYRNASNLNAGTLALLYGGTGATTAVDALTNLGGFPAASFTGTNIANTLGTTAVTNAGNADTLDSKHASDFSLAAHSHVLTATSSVPNDWLLYGRRELDGVLPDNLTGVYSYGQLLSFNADMSARFQMYVPHTASTGQSIWYRSGWGTDVKAWVKLWDSANFDPATKANTSGTYSGLSVGYATNCDTVDNQHFSYTNTSDSPTWLWASNASGTNFLANRANISVNYANYSTKLQVVDNRGTDVLPNSYSDYRVTTFFNDLTGIGTLASGITVAGWTAGYSRWQILGYSSTGSNDNLYFRSQSAGGTNSWNTLRTILHSGNYTTYSPSLTGTGASGTWGINISGTAAKLYAGGSTSGTQMVFNWSGQGGQPTWLWGGTDGTNMYVYNPSNFSVNYATSAGNADTVDSQHFSYSNTSDSPTYVWGTNASGTNFLAARTNLSVNYANSSGKTSYLQNAGQGITNIPGTGQMRYDYHIDQSTTGLFPRSNNANSVLSFNKRDGSYDSQLGFSSDGNIYYRNAIDTTTAWKVLLDSGNYSSYALPLSGGTMTGAISSNSSISTSSYINVGSLRFRSNAIEDWTTASDTDVAFNYYGYNGAGTYYRNLVIYSGKTAQIAKFEASTANLTIGGNLISAGVYSSGDVNLNNERYLKAKNTNGNYYNLVGIDSANYNKFGNGTYSSVLQGNGILFSTATTNNIVTIYDSSTTFNNAIQANYGITSSGFKKSGYDDTNVLLAGGGATARGNVLPMTYGILSTVNSSYVSSNYLYAYQLGRIVIIQGHFVTGGSASNGAAYFTIPSNIYPPANNTGWNGVAGDHNTGIKMYIPSGSNTVYLVWNDAGTNATYHVSWVYYTSTYN